MHFRAFPKLWCTVAVRVKACKLEQVAKIADLDESCHWRICQEGDHDIVENISRISLECRIFPLQMGLPLGAFIQPMRERYLVGSNENGVVMHTFQNVVHHAEILSNCKFILKLLQQMGCASAEISSGAYQEWNPDGHATRRVRAHLFSERTTPLRRHEGQVILFPGIRASFI